MPPNENNAQFLRLSSADLPERDRLEVFREIFGRTILKIEMDPLDGHALDVEIEVLGGRCVRGQTPVVDVRLDDPDRCQRGYEGARDDTDRREADLPHG